MIVILIVGLVSLFISYQGRNIKHNTEAVFHQTSQKIQLNMDSLILSLDTVSTQVVSSLTVQELLHDSNAANEPNNYFDYHYPQKYRFMDALRSINSPKDTATRISVIDNSGNFVTFGSGGFDSLAAAAAAKQLEFSKNLDLKSTDFILMPPELDRWQLNPSGSPMISLRRSMLGTDYGFVKLGEVEIQKDYAAIEKICILNVPSMQVVVFDSEMRLIFPYKGLNEPKLDMYRKAIKDGRSENLFNLKGQGESDMVSFTKSAYSGYYIMLVQPKSDYEKPVLVLVKYTILLGSILMVLTILFIFLMTKSLTSPIRSLRNAILSGTYDNPLLRPADQDSHLVQNEIDLLRRSFKKMADRLNQSANEIIQARSSEMQAHFLALQAQMNPHFLYNSLMRISVASEEAGNYDVKEMTSQLSIMLRYVTAMDNQQVMFIDEFEHAKRYLNFIKWRYEDRFVFEIHVDERMYTIQVPKLIIQPLLENSVNHGFMKVRSTWHLIIRGKYESEQDWHIEVEDSGYGFEEETLAHLLGQLDQFKQRMKAGNYQNDLEIGGLGLVNLYIRLWILLKDNLIFQITNRNEGGAIVRIGSSSR